MALAQIIVVTVILTLTSQIGLLQAKRDYEVIFDRMETKKSDFATFDYLRMTKYNRTQLVINASGILYENIPADAIVEVNCYVSLKNNQYSPIPIIVPPTTLCAFIKSDTLFYPDLVAVGNLPAKCPFKKGHYYVNNYIMNAERLPPKLPGEHWKVDVNIVSKSKTVYFIRLFVTIRKI